MVSLNINDICFSELLTFEAEKLLEKSEKSMTSVNNHASNYILCFLEIWINLM